MHTLFHTFLRTMLETGTKALAAGCLAVLLAPGLGAEDLFPDKVLEAAVRQQVFAKRESQEPLTADDVKNISQVTAWGKEGMKVKSLAGLEACKSIALIELPGHEIADVSPLKELKNLLSVDLQRNKIKDLGPLSGLSRLQYLHLAENEIEDVSPLATVTELRTLHLSRNKVKDIAPLSSLSKAWSLYLDHNEIRDLKPIAALKWVDTLDLRANGLADLSPLAGYTELKLLRLEGNKIEDLGVLVAMAQKDAAGDKRFAPFLRLYVAENPLSAEAKDKQAAELAKLGVRLLTAGEKDERGEKGEKE
jgi:hypothetical protein